MSQSANITAAIQNYLGENSADLLTLAYQTMDVWKDTTVLPNIKNKTRLSTLKVDSMVRPYNNTFQPTQNAITFIPREVGVDTAKADLELFPEDYRATYLAEFQKPGIARGPQDLPFAQYVWEDVFGKFGEDLNDNTAYFGVKNSAGSAPADVTDGFGTKLAAMITAGDVVADPIGALDSTTAIDQLTALWRTIPEKFRKMRWKQICYLSLSNYEKYMDNLDAKNWNTGRGDDYLNPKYLRKTDGMLELRPVTWMAGSNRTIITPAANILTLADATEQDLATMQVVEKIGGFDTRISCALGFDFRFTGLIWCNEVA